MATYKTPGVFVEEIPKLPPSVAQVETAIPAFIGYTQQAEKNGESLLNKAQPVASLTEFASYFGEGPDTTYETYLDASDRVTKVVSTQPYNLYDSLRLFYDNGGGKCYIISVGDYDDTVNGAQLIAALPVLEKHDEPTIIACPDATLTSGIQLYDFQKLALAQCAKLGDRVLLCDTLPSDETVSGQTFNDRVQEFRDKIGISNLKYGAAYVPYLRSSIPRVVRFRNMELRRGSPSSHSPAPLESLTSDNEILQLILDLKGSVSAVNSIKEMESTSGVLTSPEESLADAFKALFDTYSTAGTTNDGTVAIKAIYAFTLRVLAAVKAIKDTLPAKVSSTPPIASSTESVAFALKDEILSVAATSEMVSAFETLGKHSNAYGEGNDADELMPDSNSDLAAALNVLGMNSATYDALSEAAIVDLYDNPADDDAKNEEARKAIASQYPVVIKFYNALVSAAETYERTFDEALEAALGTYKQIKTSIALSTSSLPPCGVVAGIYARVDNARGVWKAPANESLNSVLGPEFLVSAEQQEGLNVDAVSGKSINAIRAFSGRGTLIWGARTLAGNDNEWRYVSVRRFFNMVEESCKKSTEPFVFENNDANTWIKVQGMIENFLTVLWRQGALQGAKPEHAFYVAVGLGKTMTSLDILEGRMIVEIGMAVVRPAEFIILKFSHKLAQS